MKYFKFSDPYETTAKFNSVCSHCTGRIKKGDPVVYNKMRGKIYCSCCNAGTEIMQGTRSEKSFDLYGTDIY